MHPIERLRSVARASGAPAGAVARESVGALMTFADDPQGMLTACRQLVTRHPGSGPMVWLACRVLTAVDKRAAAREAANALAGDPTAQELALALPDDAVVCVVGWSETVVSALLRRGDLEVRVVDAQGEASGLIRRLEGAGIEAHEILIESLGRAVASADVVVVEADALGGDGFVATAGTWAAAALGYTAGVPVWLVAGVGRLLPESLWSAVARRIAEDERGWDVDREIVPLALVSAVVGPEGVVSCEEALADRDWPIAPELLAALR
jgi:hypothetical protein